ncbi:MAG: metallophosphoesterase [Bacteroidetes bacterium]|nr:MAG: metallophosphoesterase [Bacteroidota bacterium]MBL1143626.1 metallophosphoesterase [Bacteroidota bacterium]MCB0803658.1 metallophosphoesterase family protein [Flavobacteriales bacterium]NOG56428.1 metallophosphoesterase family protein [Bacteroidota bacterium]
MKKIGLISDTHSFLHPRVKHHFKDCDEIWHAGDIGDVTLSDTLKAFKPLRAVYGNIDGAEIRKEFPKNLRFTIEELDVWITHIGGYPNRYDRRVFDEIHKNPPKLFICGHSHILKAVNDPKLNCLHLNPGAAGKVGFHQVLTLMRFNLDKGKILDLEIIELEKRI